MENIFSSKISRRTIIKAFALSFLGGLVPGCVDTKKMQLDLNRPEDNLLAFVKTRASLEEIDVVFGWTGNVYAFLPEERTQKLFQFEGFNVGRMIQIEDGYQFLTREAAFYKDPKTGEILEKWENPFTQETNKVIHVWNDPVNQKFLLKSEGGMFSVPYVELDEENICWHFDLFKNYPSPLPKSEYPQYSGSDIYNGGKFFQFFTKRSDLENAKLYSIPCQISWTRIGPWLPWMEMGDRPGYLIYQCRGKKLKNGALDLPESILDYVGSHNSKFVSAPTKFTKPNETSWTYFKKFLDKKEDK